MGSGYLPIFGSPIAVCGEVGNDLLEISCYSVLMNYLCKRNVKILQVTKMRFYQILVVYEKNQQSDSEA